LHSPLVAWISACARRCLSGDELRLKHRNASNRGAWEGSGTVTRFDQTEEVCLEMHSNVSGCVLEGWQGQCGRRS